jgi:peptidoglycan/LPS O-acetylase OafA/YrhL
MTAYDLPQVQLQVRSEAGAQPHIPAPTPDPVADEAERYRFPLRIAAIDGLRGVAVVLVMVYHFDLGLPGGFIGVDLFFTISGFVVTRRLLHQFGISTNRTKVLLQSFYVGRFWRLFPALAAVIVFVVGLSQIMDPVLGTPKRNLAHGLAAFAGLANWYRLLNPDLPGEVARPLLHTWSLSIEEQFYVCLPLLLAVFRRRARTAAYALGVFCVAASALPLPSNDPTERYFFTMARLAPIGFGVLLAAFLDGHSAKPNLAGLRRGFRSTDGVFAAIALLLLPTLRWSTWNSRSLFPVGLGLLGLLSAGLLGLLTLDRSGLASAALESRPAQYLGSRSYSLYLWHFPLAHLFMSEPKSVRSLAWVALSFLAAEISYQTIERPLRRIGSNSSGQDQRVAKHTRYAISGLISQRFARRFPLVSTSCFFLIGIFLLLK